MTKEVLKHLLENYNADYYFVDEDDLLIIVPLMFHVAVYVNPDIFFNFEDRYCFADNEVAIKAINEYLKTGKMKYWQKHWNKNISINENYAYRSGELQVKKNAIYKVDWHISNL